IAVAVTLLVSGVEMIAYSVDFGILSEGYMEVPMWIPQSFILLGAGLLLLMALARILRLLKGHDTS
ncbi:MAG: TRAP transporter small permease subunit, partial [Rhodospirillales bacterium]|nr:TRAP transporter small permease subunit [Rhodospirillales bacterium]